jgi:hypothetical protein
MHFRRTHAFSVKKEDNSMNFAAREISITGHYLTLQRQEQTLGGYLCDGLQGNKSCDVTSHARALTRSYISCLK